MPYRAAPIAAQQNQCLRFQAGTPQHQALRDGYEAVARDLVWGRQPASFADAVAAIKPLD